MAKNSNNGSLITVAIWLVISWRILQYLSHKILHLLVILAIGLVGVIIVITLRQLSQSKLAKLMSDIDKMNGLEFERYVAKQLKKHGYSNIRLTERYDLGVDIIAIKDGIRWGIQVKRYSGLVKAEAIRQVVTALNHYRCDRAMVITNSNYSYTARRLANSNQCVLLDNKWFTQEYQTS